MTRPLFNRTTAAQRRQQRVDFKAIKAQVATSHEAQRLTKRIGDRRSKALCKLRRAVSGKGSTTFSVRQLETLTRQEVAQLRAFSSERYERLTEQQQRTLVANVGILLCTVPTEVYEFVASLI
jgi:hypothetical protein